VYLVAGLKYDTKTWQEQWPKVMRNTIDACKKHNSKLIFFDNVYAYGLVTGAMTEGTPFNPNSKKGEIRARIATMLLEEINKKKSARYDCAFRRFLWTWRSTKCHL
jgi:hypothetical protein